MSVCVELDRRYGCTILWRRFLCSPDFLPPDSSIVEEQRSFSAGVELRKKTQQTATDIPAVLFSDQTRSEPRFPLGELLSFVGFAIFKEQIHFW